MNEYLQISVMASIHNISRQTLIYYDKIGLFKPHHIDENGYRYYSVYQIPYLREICFLKSIGVDLERIKTNLKDRNLPSTTELLKYHHVQIDAQIRALTKQKKYIERRLTNYENAETYRDETNKPFLQRFPDRHAIFVPFGGAVDRPRLHLTMMQAWNILNSHNLLPAAGFGTFIRSYDEEAEHMLHDAGIFMFIPEEDAFKSENTVFLKGGDYICLYKYAMPYSTQILRDLLCWIRDNQYTVTGPILDECILDTTFHTPAVNADFCRIQVPVSRK